MHNTFFENKKIVDRDSSFGNIFVSKSDMADNGDMQSDVRNGDGGTIHSFLVNLLCRIYPHYSTPNKIPVYQLPLSVKIAFAFLAGWETIVEKNVIVQWIVVVFMLVSSGIWIYSQLLSVLKKKLISTNTSASIYTRIIRIATAQKQQDEINRMILSCLVLATLIVLLVLINSNS